MLCPLALILTIIQRQSNVALVLLYQVSTFFTAFFQMF